MTPSLLTPYYCSSYLPTMPWSSVYLYCDAQLQARLVRIYFTLCDVPCQQ